MSVLESTVDDVSRGEYYDADRMTGDNQQDGRKLRAEQRRNLRREQILSAARKVFSVKGYHACSVADILAEAGIARGTFYLYFPSKRHIFDELLEGMFSQITRSVHRIEIGPGAEPHMDQMYHNIQAIVDVLEGNKELTIIMLREAVGLDADFDHKLHAFYYRLCDMVESALSLGQSMGLVRECNTRLFTYFVLGSVKEMMIQLLTDEKKNKPDRETLVREIMDYNLHGLFRDSARQSSS